MITNKTQHSISSYYRKEEKIIILLKQNKNINSSISDLNKTEKKVIIYTETDQQILLDKDWTEYQHTFLLVQTHQGKDNRWVVIALNNDNKEATIHSSSAPREACEEVTILKGLLSQFLGLKNSNNPNIDDDRKTRDTQTSGIMAVLYIEEILKRLKNNEDISSINTYDFDFDKTKLHDLSEECKKIDSELASIRSIEDLEKDSKELTEQIKNKTIQKISSSVTSKFTEAGLRARIKILEKQKNAIFAAIEGKWVHTEDVNVIKEDIKKITLSSEE